MEVKYFYLSGIIHHVVVLCAYPASCPALWLSLCSLVTLGWWWQLPVCGSNLTLPLPLLDSHWFTQIQSDSQSHCFTGMGVVPRKWGARSGSVGWTGLGVGTRVAPLLSPCWQHQQQPLCSPQPYPTPIKDLLSQVLQPTDPSLPVRT